MSRVPNDEQKDFSSKLSIDIFVSDDAPIEKMSEKINEFQSQDMHITVSLLRNSDIEETLQKEYQSLEFLPSPPTSKKEPKS